MILVSTPGTWAAVYAPLDHALWHGWTPTDLVFPFLLFAMGAAVPFALARRRARPRAIRRHVFRRAAMLFALGLLLNAIETPPPLQLATFRIPGVLQRIAIVYAVLAWLTERTSRRVQWIVAAGVLLGYWALLLWVPIPRGQAGALTPEGNLASFVDRAVFGRHLLSPLTDPEGLLSTLPAIATALAGVFAGEWLRGSANTRRTFLLWLAGAAATLAGLVWGRVFPLNKNLWTSSFALFSGGLAAQALAVFHWCIDTRRWRRWTTPFTALGRNALAMYFLSVGFDSVLTRWSVPQGSSLKSAIYGYGFAPWLRPCCGAETASLAYAIVYVMLWCAVAVALQRRRIFIGI